MKKIRTATLAFGTLLTASLIAILYARAAISENAADYVFNDPSQVPSCETALVLGCAKTLSNGRENLFFKYRIEKAAELFHTGKIKRFIVSGDNSRIGYNEPADMKASLIQAGVPEDAIHCDYAGFSTLDSIVRAKEVFGQSRLIVISQDFHNQRAVYIGRNHGIEIYGLNARSVDRFNSLKTELREELARVKTVLDVRIFNRRPKFLGEPVAITSR